jgi:polyisoprenoid-binding protein YceI
MAATTSLLLTLALSAVPATTSVDDYTRFVDNRLLIDSAHSVIRFGVAFAGLTETEGCFKRFSGTLMLDPADLRHSSIAVRVRTDSIDTANEMRDKDLASATFLDAEKYPFLTFRSERIERRGEDWVAIGNLNLHGVSRPVEIPFHRIGSRLDDPWGNKRLAFAAAITLKRADYGVGGLGRFGKMQDAVIGDDVEITLKIQTVRSNYDRWDLADRSVAQALEKVLESADGETAVRRYHELKASSTGDYAFEPGPISVLAHRLLQHRRLTDATALFTLLTTEHPESAEWWDGLATSAAGQGRREAALIACRKALALDPENPDVLETMRWLGETRATGPDKAGEPVPAPHRRGGLPAA